MSKTIQNKKLLTLDDLYNFYFSKNENCTFSSKETGYKLSVQVPAQFEVNKEQNDDSLLFCKVKLMHSGENRNRSSVTDDALVKASKCLAYKPILANFMEYTDEETGETLKDFTSHDMEFNEDGTVTYLEKQIGCFTSDDPYFEIEEDTGHNFLYGYCAIPKEYSDAYSIIKRKDGTKVSVELEINEMQYSASKKILELTDITIMGATCLGKDAITLNNIEEGMKNARLDIADFSVENNSVKFDKDEKLIELLETLNKTLSNFNNKEYFSAQDNSKEGGNEKTMFEKLLEKYGKTIEDITFEYENLSDEGLEQKFAELFDEENPDNSEKEPSNDDEGEDGSESEGSADNGKGEDNGENPEKNPGDGTYSLNPEKYSVTMSDGTVKDFALSLDEITSALQTLVNNMYADDDTWYSVIVYEDGTLIMTDWWNNKYFKQSYTREGDNFSLVGDRVAVHSVWVTDEEEDALNEMRSNYTALKEFKETVEQNELHAQREKILNSDKYAVLAEKNEEGEYVNADFAELVKDMDNYSLTDLETKVKVMHSDFVSEHQAENMTFSAKPEKKKMTSVKLFANPNDDKKSKPSRYGNLFKESK